MKPNRTKHAPIFKSLETVETIKREQLITEHSRRFKVRLSQMLSWKKAQMEDEITFFWDVQSRKKKGNATILITQLRKASPSSNGKVRWLRKNSPLQYASISHE